MKRINEDYYLGLDIGTNSIGWAVTDTNYNILKLKDKSAWGVRLFDEADTANERRMFRSNRRRKKRYEWRLELIRQLFENEINKVDENFFVRMKNSAFYLEDKEVKEKCILFTQKEFADRDYYQKYPTIYHLRKELMDSNEPHDIRLVFLAIYHIVKHRGHFLWSGDYEVIDKNNIDEEWEKLLDFINEKYDLSLSNVDSIKKVILSKVTKNDKKKEIKELLKKAMSSDNKSNFNQILDIFNLIVGSKVDMNNFVLGCDDDIRDISFKENKKIEFDSEKIDEEIDDLSTIIGDDNIEIIRTAKEFYDRVKLNKVIGEYGSISNSKIKAYEKHKNDLKLLKNIIKEYCPKKYNEIFRDTNGENYVAYAGKLVIDSKKHYTPQCKREKFYEYIWKILKDVNDERIKAIKVDIDNNNFLPLERWSDNGVIPNQLHRAELVKILDNAKTYLSFLSDKDSNGLSTYDKILATFDFRIPYYIGPLNDYHKDNSNKKNKKGAWLSYKENKTKLYPWNYMEHIDVEKTHEDFILRMTNKCTYLPQYDVLPKNSLLYQEYMVLNEINILRINGNKLNENEKKVIFELFKKTKKVTLNKLIECLIAEGLYKKDEITKDNISGINKNKDIISNLSTYHKFKEFFKDKIDNDSSKQIIDCIVKYLTIYSDDEEVVKSRIEKEYGEKLKEIFGKDYNNNLRKMCKIKCQGWGRFSREFLCLSGVEVETGEKDIIINFLRDKSLSLMEIIATDNFTFKEILQKNIKEFQNELKYDLVDELYVSPSVKRAIWQTFKIVNELVKIIGKEPKKIFVEMARSDEEKKETTSRKNMLQKLYDSLNDEEYLELKQELSSESDDTLRRKDLYLYYTQLGRDMYTGQPINIANLNDNKTYDIDHIYPRSKSGQDSIIKNLVLTNRKSNASKGDNLVPKDVQMKMQNFWKVLKHTGLITDEKYNRLIRKNDFTDDELAGFIDRQLVETRQSSKVVKDILSQYFGDKSKIVSVHANLVSKFRNGENMSKDENGNTIKYTDFVKVRSLNDYHHAKDAYLNIVVGNVYNTKFTDNPKLWIKAKKENREKYSLNWVFAKDVDNAWVAGENGTIKVIEKYMNKNDIIVTVQECENKGAIYNQTIYPSLKHKPENSKGTTAKIALKHKGVLSNLNKYGGYSGLSSCYFVVYAYDLIDKSIDKRGNDKQKITDIYRLDTVPLKDILKIRNSKEYIYSVDKNNYEKEKVFELIFNDIEKKTKNDENKKMEISNFRIIKTRILKNTVISINGFKYYIRSNNENQIMLGSAEELYLSDKDTRYVKKIEKVINDNLGKKVVTINEKYEVSEKENIRMYDLLINKMEYSIYKYRSNNQSKKLKDNRDKFQKLGIYEQCVVINQIINNFSCKNTNAAKLNLLGLGEVGGNLTLSKNLDLVKNDINLYNYSVTGLYCEKVDLNGLADSEN